MVYELLERNTVVYKVHYDFHAAIQNYRNSALENISIVE